ncbi:MAG: proline racemase family protein [Ekhidna sp.]|nr:proline racemase family protein [Ekhidna sp.]MBC6425997.1 proline racemase family protein [Ekhidna sp.]
MKFSTNSYHAPRDWMRIQSIDMHTGGEPLRVILDGFPALKGKNVLELRRYAKAHYDHLRTALMFEPRGHADMYGCIIVSSEVADFGVIFLHNEGYSTMCGHATIAITKLAVEAGWVKVEEPETSIKIEAPCGVLTACARVKNGVAHHIRFLNVPSFVVALDEQTEVPGIGKVTYDLAYGGAFYAYVDAGKLGLSCTPDHYQQLISTGMKIKRSVIKSSNKIHHPSEEDLSFLYGTIFIGGPVSEGVNSRNVCVFAEGEVDRSPTGSGVSGRVAIHHRRNELAVGESMRIESILGSTFDCKIIKTEKYGSYQAVIPEVSGEAHYTGKNEFWIDPNDPFNKGFIFR